VFDANGGLSLSDFDDEPGSLFSIMEILWIIEIN
jgi:hypothetical protein